MSHWLIKLHLFMFVYGLCLYWHVFGLCLNLVLTNYIWIFVFYLNLACNFTWLVFVSGWGQYPALYTRLVSIFSWVYMCLYLYLLVFIFSWFLYVVGVISGCCLHLVIVLIFALCLFYKVMNLTTLPWERFFV